LNVGIPNILKPLGFGSSGQPIKPIEPIELIEPIKTRRLERLERFEHGERRMAFLRFFWYDSANQI
jgi:hypothetical protein